MSKNLYEPSLSSQVSGQGYRVRQLERRPAPAAEAPVAFVPVATMHNHSGTPSSLPTITNNDQVSAPFRAGSTEFHTNDTTYFQMYEWLAADNPETWDAWALEILQPGMYQARALISQRGATDIDGEVSISMVSALNPSLTLGNPFSWPEGGTLIGEDRSAYSDNEVSTISGGMPTLIQSRMLICEATSWPITIYIERNGGTAGTAQMRAYLEVSLWTSTLFDDMTAEFG